MAENESDVVASIAFFKAAFHRKTSNNKKRKTNSRTGIKRKGKKVEMHFKTENDQRYPWMTGCKKTNCTVLYCWGCLLFRTDKSSTWSAAAHLQIDDAHEFICQCVNDL